MKILVNNSFPILISIGIFNLLGSVAYFLIFDFYDTFIISNWIIYKMVNKWWSKIIKESLIGFYKKKIKNTIKYRFILFITSEVILFLSLFWIFFHRRISPNIEIGIVWPPNNTEKSINPIRIPLAIRIILLISRFRITLAHHFAINNLLKESKTNFKKTLILGLTFITLQIIEYSHPGNKIPIRFNDSIYANSFFFITALHGSHVIGGSLFLKKSIKIFKRNSNKNIINIEISIWYWHFVDLIWVFVFSFIYWWNIFL